MLRTFVAMLPAVGGVAVLSVVALCGFRAWAPFGDLTPSNAEVGNYLQAVGTFYGVLLAFVTSAVWNQFEEARHCVEVEANEVADLRRTAEGLPDAERAVLQRALTAYVDAVIRDEWRAMAAGDEATIARTGAMLDEVWRSLHTFEPARECHKALHAEALTRFNDLSDARANRLSAARTRMPSSLVILLYVGATIVISSMFLLAIDRFAIHALITGALAGAVSHVLLVIRDLDDTFAGNWRVTPAAFERVAASAERSKQPG